MNNKKGPTVAEYRVKIVSTLVTHGFNRHFAIKAVGFHQKTIAGMYFSSYNAMEAAKFVMKDLIATDPTEVYGGMLEMTQQGDRKVA